ncbi:hypothetical protein D3C78_1350670 [compost metagenome]
MIFYGLYLSGPGLDGLGEACINIIDIQVQADRGATERLTADQATVHVARVCEHQRRIADFQFSMAHTPIGAVEAEHYYRTERSRVEVDGLGGIFDTQVGGDGVLPFGDWFDGHFIDPP